MQESTHRTFRSPVSIRHEGFGEIRMRFAHFDPIARLVRTELSNEHLDGRPIVRCAVRHMHRAVLDQRRRILPEERNLRKALVSLSEYDKSPIEIVYPELRVRGPRGRTHSRDVVLQALCRRHRIAIPSPPMGVEAVHGDAPPLIGDRPHTALTGLPEEFPAIRLLSWSWTGAGTNVSMRWGGGMTYVAADSFTTIEMPGCVPETVLSRLVGRTADTVADVPGFDRIRIERATCDQDLGRTTVEGRHDTRITLDA